MLQLSHISKSYVTNAFTQVALDDVSLAFRDNEFVSILGQSGSGKTTMLNVIGGLDHFDSGDLLIDGVSTRQYKDRDWDAYRNNRIGFVFQSYNLIPHQTILANVELALTLSGVSPAERRERAHQALVDVGLGDHVDKRPSQLSGGQMQRVAIARALINDPEILLADEPTGALDSRTSVQVMDLLREVASDRLVIMVTHNPELAREYSTRIVELADGRIAGDSDPFDASTAPVRRARPARRTSMSFLTALSLSFNNLMTKKGRTLMTAFAGSIGIIGIAAILALANGVNAYIQEVEEDTLSVYPLQIMSSGFDMTSMIVDVGSQQEDDSSETEQSAESPASEDGNTVREMRMVTNMFSRVGKNDLAYVDSVIAGHPTMWWDPAALIDTLAYAYITMEFGEHKADLSKWGGICFEYTADMDFDFKVKANAIVEIYDSPAEFNPTFTVKVPKSDSPNIVSIKWDEIYGKNVPEYFDAVFSSIADFKIVFKGDGVFKMTQFGSLGQCVNEEKTEIVAHRTHTAPSLSISGRKLHLDGIDNGKVAIFTATGKAVLSGRATGTIDLSSLKSGVYMVKVVAPNYNRAERIVIR